MPLTMRHIFIEMLEKQMNDKCEQKQIKKKVFVKRKNIENF